MKKNPEAHPRRAKILELLAHDGEISVQHLTALFGVTPMTIRRDLEALENQGSLTRTHGGAIFSQRAVAEFAFLEQGRKHQREKEAIAREAAQLVQPGMTIVLDTGTTTLEVARAVAGISNLTVLTSSLAIASALHASNNVELVLLGGNVRRRSPDLMGPLTEENLDRFRVRMAILGADGADSTGVFTTELSIARVSRAMVQCARETVLVADSSKFEHPSFVRYADWKNISRVVTDDGLPSAARKWLSKAVGDVHYVRVAKERKHS